MKYDYQEVQWQKRLIISDLIECAEIFYQLYLDADSPAEIKMKLKQIEDIFNDIIYFVMRMEMSAIKKEMYLCKLKNKIGYL